MDGNGSIPSNTSTDLADTDTPNNQEIQSRKVGPKGHQLSQEIPILRLVDAEGVPAGQGDNNISNTNKSCELVHVKEEPETRRDSDDGMDDGEDNSMFGGEIHPDPEVIDSKGGIIESDTTSKCANCNLILKTKKLLDGSKNFHEFLPLQLCNADSGDLMDVELIDAIFEIFKLQPFKNQSFKKIYQRNDLYLCKECCDILVQMYKLYHEFALIAVQSRSFLATYINRDRISPTLVAKPQAPSRVNEESISPGRKVGINRSLVEPVKRRSLRKRQKTVFSSTEEEMEHDDVGSDPVVSDMDDIRSPLENTTTTHELPNISSGNVARRSRKKKRSISKNKIQKCDTCNIAFKFPIQLLKHLKSQAHKSKSRSISASGAGTEKTTPDSRLRACPEPNCNKTFTGKKLLQRHMKVHWTEGMGSRGECERCGKKFKTLGGLKIHYASHVRDDQKYSCTLCTKKFRKQEALEMHSKTDHGSFKPHQCSQCDKTFRLKDKLKLHIMVIHNKIKPFPCTKCEKAFRTKYHLKIHDVSQHIQGGDSTIGCSQCKCKFPDRDALEKHVVIHAQDKPFVCDSCGKGFQTTARLKLHDKSHLEVPSCLCPICGRAYKHIRDLRLHEVIHQDESTYRFGCGDCPRRFYRIDLLRVHQSNEKHFSSETIGPSISKVMPNKESECSNRTPILAEDEDDEEDENETDTEIAPSPLPPPKSKKKFKTVKDCRDSNFREKGNPSAAHPHAPTLIYNPSNAAQLHLDQSPNILSSSGIKNHNSTALMSSSLPYHANTISQQRHISNQASAGPSSYFITQRDRQNILHHPALQIQTMSSGAHSQIQFGNQTVYTSHPINMINNSGAGGTDPTGFDFINSFNLG